jgi:methyl-accepting chemotaxis protein
VSTKILTAVVIGLVLAVGVGVLGLSRLGSTAGQVRAMYTVQVKPLRRLSEVQRTAMQSYVDLLTHNSSLDVASQQKAEAAIKQDDDQVT